MSNEFSRTRRIGLQIQRDLADLIQNELKDPRIGIVTVNAVQVSRDLSHAKVYITTLDDSKRQQVVDILQKAAGFLRHELGQRLSIRVIPQLHFFYDESIEQGAKLTSLIEEAVRSDEQKHKQDDNS